jgi:hypothetical protein
VLSQNMPFFFIQVPTLSKGSFVAQPFARMYNLHTARQSSAVITLVGDKIINKPLFFTAAQFKRCEINKLAIAPASAAAKFIAGASTARFDE